MAVVQRLPNGFIVLLMSPREATIVSDLLLDPDDFPWNGTEQQITGLEVRMRLRTAVAEEAIRTLQDVNEVINAMAETNRRKEAMLIDEPVGEGEEVIDPSGIPAGEREPQEEKGNALGLLGAIQRARRLGQLHRTHTRRGR